MNEDEFSYIVQLLVERAVEASADSKAVPEDLFQKGRKIAYYEVLDTIKNQLLVNDQKLEEYHLDFDLEHSLW